VFTSLPDFTSLDAPTWPTRVGSRPDTHTHTHTHLHGQFEMLVGRLMLTKGARRGQSP